MEPDQVPTLQPHQQRVVAEHDELRTRLDKLQAFIGGPRLAEVSLDEWGDLLEQAEAMGHYLAVLARRIARWDTAAPNTGA